MDEQLRALQGLISQIFADGSVGVLRAFWYFLLIEFPRFILSDLVVLIVRYRNRGRSAEISRLHPYTVVAPVLNESNTMGNTIRSLLEQTVLPERIILIDDGSTDDTATICRHYANENPKIQFFSMGDRSGKSAALNRGLREVETEIVVFVDADTTFDRDAMHHEVQFTDHTESSCVRDLSPDSSMPRYRCAASPRPCLSTSANVAAHA